MQITQKENSLLKDLKDQEQLCVDKYKKHSQSAVDPQLKNLFSQIAGVEQAHYNALSQIGNGEVPQSIGNGVQVQSFNENYGQSESQDKKNDCYLCTDLLTIEKHASSLYNTCVFEFRDEQLRRVLSDIQRDEQHHGKLIYDYMVKNGMYS